MADDTESYLTWEEAAADDAEAKGDETQAEEPEVKAKAETPTEEPEAATPAEPESDTAEETHHVPLKALTSEREKRQAAERERDELRKQLESKSQPEEPEKPKTSVFDDEDAAFTERLSQVEIQRHSDRYDMSQALAEDKWGEEKVAEAAEKFRELVKSNPELGKEMFEARLPYFQMMKIVERQQQVEELKDPDAVRAKLRAEIEAELREKYEAEAAEKRSKRSGLQTPSLASARSTQSGTAADDPRIETAEEVFPT